MSKPTEKLGRYEVTETLGKGAMGVVYKAYDPVIARSVALKTIRRDLLDSDQAVESIGRFRNEAMASGRLNHPGIVAIYEYGEQGDTVFIVMEYAPGDTLHGYLARRDSIKLSAINDIMSQLLEALDFAHENGIVHRDVKPANIIVSPSGRIKVTDFGIARINTSTLTQTGMIMGTPSYMAPEQYVGLALDRRADVFSAGVVLYELLTGIKPFVGAPHTVAYKICHEAHDPPSQINAQLPYGLDAVVARALAKKPDDRFSTAREFGAALAAAVQRHSAGADEPTWIPTLAPHKPVSATGSGQDHSSLAMTGWAPGALSSLESALAPYVGPLARTLVKRNAAKAFQLSELQENLALAIDDPADRTSFMEASRPLFAQLSKQSVPVNPGGTSQSADSLNALNPAVLERATVELSVFLGPIAKVLVKKAAAKANGVQDFYVRLSEHLSNDDEKSRFFKALGH
jgi:serine/threonine protein kinase